MASSLSALSLGGGGQTSDSIMSSVVFVTQVVRSGGSVLLLLIIMHRDISSCNQNIRPGGYLSGAHRGEQSIGRENYGGNRQNIISKLENHFLGPLIGL